MTNAQNQQSPAELAAEKTLKAIFSCLDTGQSFRLEAGAGAGKTHSLIEGLKYLIKVRGKQLIRDNQQVACITYTNVATEEIRSRIDGNAVVAVSTIHSFAWQLIQDFQPFLRESLKKEVRWQERFATASEIDSKRVEYDQLGFPSVNDTTISLHHDDVIRLFVAILELEKFRSIFCAKFPILFIDEYQDTDQKIADALKKHFFADQSRLLIGFFGDHWQKIYKEGCGLIKDEKLLVIDKGANFRSVKPIVEVLNQMRPELTQAFKDPNSSGYVGVFHTNGWIGERLTGGHAKGDLPPETAHAYLEKLRGRLSQVGWDQAPDQTKILMLTHNVLAKEQGYSGIAKVFDRTDSYIKREDGHMAFLVDVLEPACIAFSEKKYGELFSILGSRKPILASKADKVAWTRDMTTLLKLRKNGTIHDVLAHISKAKRPQLPERLVRKEKEFSKWLKAPDPDNRSMARLNELRKIPYEEVVQLAKFVHDQTPFSTKHGVKGAQFPNVLVVLGRGWNMYNFDNFLKWSANPAAVPEGDREAYERNRNLFYVSCSRPQARLALLFTQELSPLALETLEKWFGKRSIWDITKI